MSNRQDANVRTIHPKALAETSEAFCLVALEVARDLRNGVIPPWEYDQSKYCGTACCIGGHIAHRLGIDVGDMAWDFIENDSLTVVHGNRYALFAGTNPPYVDGTPESAANAIERYIYEGSETPWRS